MLRGGVQVQLYSFLNLSTRRGRVVNATSRLLYLQEKCGTHCIGGWVGPKASLEGAENLTPNGIQSPDRPAHSKSLYQLSYPGPLSNTYTYTLYSVIILCDNTLYCHHFM